MNSPTPSTSSVPPYRGSTTIATESRLLYWGAIFAGAVAALACQIVLMMLGAALGLAAYSPLTADHPVAEFGAGAAVIHGLVAVFALWMGGWVAGRFTGRSGLKGGSLHGFMVWCLATVTAIIAVSASAGWALGDLSKIVGGGLSMAGKPIAAVVGGSGDLAKDAVNRSQGMIQSFQDEGLSNAAAGKSPTDTIRAKRDLGFALAHLFAADPTKRVESEQAVVSVLVEQRGMSADSARKMVDEWVASYQKLQADLETAKQEASLKTKEAADTAAHDLSILSLCSFAAFVLGAIFATIGGKHGGLCGYKRTEMIASAS